MKDAVVANPVTTVAAVGAIVSAIGHFVGWDAETQAIVAQAVIGAALIARGIVAWWDSRTGK